jgi:hypothetical protein
VTDDDDSEARALAHAAGLPRYNAPVLDIVAKPPFLHRDTVLHGFILRSNMTKLQTAIDTLFGPLGLNYQVETSAVLLTALYVGRAMATEGRYVDLGWSSEIDLAFWALARGTEGLVWIPFYMFVDSGVALIAGREVYGFPKQLARFDRDMTTLGDDPRVAVRTDFFRPLGAGPTAALKDQVLVRIRAAPAGVGFLEDGEEGPRSPERIDETEFLERFGEAMGRPPGLVAELTPPYARPNGVSVPMLFLKQFRDAAAPDRACYRAAVRLDTRSAGDIQIAEIKDRFAVDLTPSGSHPIAADLGLTSGMVAEAGFIIRQDFDVSQATVLP